MKSDVTVSRRKAAETAEKIVRMARLLDVELDGVRIPATAAAIVMRIRSLLKELDDYTDQ